MLSCRVLLLVGCLGWATLQTAIAGGLEPQQAAQHVDELLAKELFGGAGETKPAAKADDQTFLRRVYLDLVGHPPTPEDVTAFSLDTSPNKRAAVAARLLASPQFGENWSRYWRDVIMYRRSEDRAMLAAPAAVRYLTDALNNDPHWDKIAKKMITATGDVREEGATALVMAQMGIAEDTTAEVSRIFMGIQIQCAQCHNHPTDRWKREQFHQLAAFFPRVAVRPVRKGEERSFAVVSIDRERGKKNDKKPKKGSLEHHMPDLNHPDQEGKVMRPVFFVTGQHMDLGHSDQERREKIADWITSRKNRWFSKALVNRMWSELVGHGFYEPVDDIGPDRACASPQTLDYLSDQFAAHQYDLKWLYATIAATEAYQRESRSRYETEQAPFLASCPQRLRGDQLYDSLIEVLGIPDPDAKVADNPRRAAAGPRGRVNQTFGFDPSVRRDEIAGSIPQALFLMNAPELARGFNGQQQNTNLGKLLADTLNDDDVIDELYLRCLAREPKTTERQTCRDYVQTTGNRTEAFEDILWSLVNSTEFLNRK